MKKVTAVLAVVVMVVSLVSMVFAADAKKAVIKSVDAKASTIVVTEDGKDMTLNVDKSVDLGKAKAGDKVMITVEKDTVMSMKPARSKAAVGC